MRTNISMSFRVGFVLLCLMIGLHIAPNTLSHFSNTAFGATSETTSPSGLESANFKDVLIRFQEGTSSAEREAYITKISGELLLWIEPLNTATVRVPSDFELLETALSTSVNSASATSTSVNDTTNNGHTIDQVVMSMEEDGMVYGTFEPDDPDLYRGQRVYTAELLGMFDAWDYTTGAPEVIVAVLDTGIASSHPEFAGRIRDGYDFYNDDDDPEDDHGHGTHVSGTIAAAIDNGVGGAGLCGQCSILPIKVLNQNNAGTWSGVAAGITHAADNDADIIVMSLGSTSGTKVVEDAINYAIDNDVLIIAAAGNANSNRNFYPAAYEGVIGVSATNQNDERWVLSNYGSYVDLSAPGHVIYSTSNDLDNSYAGHVFMSGTSMATPHVGGLAGLLKSQDPTRSSIEITDILLSTALDLGDSGVDDYFGHGRIDPVAALTFDHSVTLTATLGGNVWLDSSADGLQDEDELDRISGIDITLYDAQGREVAATKSTDGGTWEITNLNPGQYRISATDADESWIWTNEDQASITLTAGQTVTNKMLGFVHMLPTTVVTDMNVYRSDKDVVIVWQVASSLVTGLALERSIGESPYEVLQEYDLTFVDVSGNSQSFADILPDDLGNQTVSYRIQVQPGGTYVGTFEAIDQPDNAPITAVPPDVERSGDEIVVFVPLLYLR